MRNITYITDTVRGILYDGMFFTIGPFGDHYTEHTDSNADNELMDLAGTDALTFLGEVLLPEAYWDELQTE